MLLMRSCIAFSYVLVFDNVETYTYTAKLMSAKSSLMGNKSKM